MFKEFIIFFSSFHVLRTVTRKITRLKMAMSDFNRGNVDNNLQECFLFFALIHDSQIFSRV